MQQKECYDFLPTEFEELQRQLEDVHEFARDQVKKCLQIAHSSEIELMNQKTAFIIKLKEKTDQNKLLLDENIKLKVKQQQTLSSAGRIAVFISEWNTRYSLESQSETKIKLYQKEKAYDELLKKYFDLESLYYQSIEQSIGTQQRIAKEVLNSEKIIPNAQQQQQQEQEEYSPVDHFNESSSMSCEKKAPKKSKKGKVRRIGNLAEEKRKKSKKVHEKNCKDETGEVRCEEEKTKRIGKKKKSQGIRQSSDTAFNSIADTLFQV